ncbi:MAG: MBL fold metallo-hydrolase [Dehalococcoidia bacterium]|nr:MBL fold metallo-hydrolase [Dehalococcoidia bacterium]
MSDPLALSARIIDSGSDSGERTNRINGELSELAPGIAMVEAFGHVVAFDTGAGLLVFDTSSVRSGGQAVTALRTWRDVPVDTIVFTHGHLDHVGGAAAFLDDAVKRGDPKPRIVAQANVARRMARYDLTNGYNAIINARQFGTTRLTEFRQERFMTGFVRPDFEFEEHAGLRIGGLTVRLRHALGETDDHTWAWIPEHRAICSGDLLTWVFPNAGNPQKVQRYPGEWAAALREMIALEPELLLPAHGLPISGRARIRLVLDEVATALEGLVDEVLRRMNAGERLDAIVAAVKVPESMLQRPWLRPVYDEPEFVVRNTWRLYGGWYDGNPANLKPAPERELAGEVAAMSGGPARLAARAEALSAEGQHRLACHLVEMAALAAPGDGAIQRSRAAVYEARAGTESSLMARGIFLSAATESREAVGEGG